MRASTILSIGCATTVWAGLTVERRQSNWTVGQEVQTTSGMVKGHKADNQSEVSEYLGIPFGKAPIGDLRFAAPVKYDNKDLNHSGLAYGFSCPVQSGGSLNISNLGVANITAAGPAVLSLLSSAGPFDEDCLNLNVWTRPQVGEAKKAVLVWIYGGGFNSGSSAPAGYNGANIVEEEDVVLVSFNYRLSILGFPGNPNGTQNLALLDQRLAVEWVRDNIEKFGGDPSRITLFGQSAGAASVDFYSYAWKKDPIVAGFIPESGNAFGWGLPNTEEFARNAWFNVSQNLNCGDANSDPTENLACMRKANYSEVLDAVPNLGSTGGILGLFGPTIDGTVVFENYTNIEPAPIPMLIGNNNYEGGYFRTTFALAGTFFPDIFWDWFNLQEFTCPTGIRANVSYAAKTPIWRYRYFGVWPNLAVSSEAGAYHVAEVPMLFNTVPNSPAASEEQISIAKYMRGAWAAFAKDPEKGLSTYGDGGWPTYDPTKDTLIRLAWDNVTGPNLANPAMYDGWCSVVDVHSTNETAYLAHPEFNPTVPPNGTVNATTTENGSGNGGSPSGSGTGSAPSALTTGAGSRVELSVWVGLAAAAAWFL